MKTLIASRILIVFLVCGVIILAAPPYCLAAPNNATWTDSLNIARIQINKTAMFTLGAWSLGNMAVNGTLLALQANTPSADRTQSYYFQQMNVFWNVVNLGLAAGGLYGAFTENPHGVSLFETINQQSTIERILLLNAGLDVAYITAGAWMLERSKNASDNTALWQGYGQSLILQGAFLLLFDAVVYAIHHSTSEPLLREILRSTSMGIHQGQGLGLGFVLRL
jgi:hypothetical protein